MLLLTVVIACAFVVGMSISKGSTCAVTAAKELVFERHGTMLIGFAIAASVAGLVTHPLNWVSSATFHLAADVPISLALVAGAVLIGIGAVINDACLLGTLARIGQGEVRFLALPVGLAFGFAIADRQSLLAAGMSFGDADAVSPLPGWLVVVMSGALLIAAWLYQGQRGRLHPTAHTWPRGVMVVMGICGAVLFALEPHWTYSDAVHAAVDRGGMDARTDARALVISLALVAGSVLSGILARVFVFQKPSFAQIGRSVAGGAVMALGGTLIPGGNDSLLLAAIPSGTLSGLTAYAIMSLTVPAVLWITRTRQRAAPLSAR